MVASYLREVVLGRPELVAICRSIVVVVGRGGGRK